MWKGFESRKARRKERGLSGSRVTWEREGKGKEEEEEEKEEEEEEAFELSPDTFVSCCATKSK